MRRCAHLIRPSKRRQVGGPANGRGHVLDRAEETRKEEHDAHPERADACGTSRGRLERKHITWMEREERIGKKVQHMDGERGKGIDGKEKALTHLARC